MSVTLTAGAGAASDNSIDLISNRWEAIPA